MYESPVRYRLRAHRRPAMYLYRQDSNTLTFDADVLLSWRYRYITMRPLSSIDAIAFSELRGLCRSETRGSPYTPNGAFVRQDRGGRLHWYYKGYERPVDGSPGRQTLKYVGAVGDPAIDQAAVEHERRREISLPV